MIGCSLRDGKPGIPIVNFQVLPCVLAAHGRSVGVDHGGE